MPFPACTVRKSLNITDEVIHFVVEFSNGSNVIASAYRNEMDAYLFKYLFDLNVGEVIPSTWLLHLDIDLGECQDYDRARLVPTRKDHYVVQPRKGKLHSNHRAGRSWTTKRSALPETEAQLIVNILFKLAERRGVLHKLQEKDGQNPLRFLRKMLRILEGGRW